MRFDATDARSLGNERLPGISRRRVTRSLSTTQASFPRHPPGVLCSLTQEVAMPVFVKMLDTNELAVVTNGVDAKEKAGALKVFDAKGNVVGNFKKVEQWYIGQAEPLKPGRSK